MKIDNIQPVGTQAKAPFPVQSTGADAPVANVFPQLGGQHSRPDVSSDASETITPEMMDKAVQQANKALSSFDKAIERTVHEKTHAIIYVLRDTVTNEVIREFPPKKIQDMIAKMWELAGLFVDERG